MRIISTLSTVLFSFFAFTNIAEAVVNINTASQSELTALPGIGDTKALAIVEYRNANGAFASCDDLSKIKGIGPSTLEKLKPECSTGDGTVAPASTNSASTGSTSTPATSTGSGSININTADGKTLEKFNGVGPSTAQKIIDYRTANGNFASCDDLSKVAGIGPATLAKIKPDCTTGESQ